MYKYKQIIILSKVDPNQLFCIVILDLIKEQKLSPDWPLGGSSNSYQMGLAAGTCGR